MNTETISMICSILVIAGMILGYIKKQTISRVGKTIICFAFLLINWYPIYDNGYYYYNISFVWLWLPAVVCAGIMAICVLNIWNLFNIKKRLIITSTLVGVMVVLTIIAAMAFMGEYKGNFLHQFSRVREEGLIISSLIIAFIIFLSFRKNEIASRIGKSILFALILFGIWGIAYDAITFDLWYGPARLSTNQIILTTLTTTFCIGAFLICLLFIWKLFKVKVRRIIVISIASVMLLFTGIFTGVNLYDESLTFVSEASEVESQGRDISLVEYEPFRENTLAKSLSEPSSLRLLDNLPRLEGATALYPLYAAFARAVYPEAKYPVYSMDNFFQNNNNPVITCSMTSGAFERLICGEADLIFLMGVSEEQREMARERGLELKLTPIGREAFVFFVNKRNTISNLTVDDVRGIYSGQITNWREVGGKNDKIKPYQRAKNSGSQTMLMEIMGDTPLMTAPPSDYHDMMYEIYRAVAVYKNYKNSLGYSFLFYINNMIAENKIKFLSINGVEPTATNIADGTYPFANDFYAITVVREPENEVDAERMNNTEKLIEWMLSPQGQSLVEKTGYVPLQVSKNSKTQIKTNFNIDDVGGIIVTNSSEFDGTLINENRIVKLNTIESVTAKEILKTAKYKNDIVLWKGYTKGLILGNGANELGASYGASIKISNYGGFFSIVGEEGYYVIDDKYREEWDSYITDFTIQIDGEKYKPYDDVVEITSPAEANMGHLYFFFGDAEFYTVCSHGDFSLIDEYSFYEVVDFLSNSDVKVIKYRFNENNDEPNDPLELIYKNGVYIKWDAKLQTITKILNIIE